jgi:anti-sigma factor RsiW
MNHQPFENWILDETRGSPSEKEQLENHLKVCSQCARLQRNWNGARQQFVTGGVKKAPARFATQWPERLAMFKYKRQRKQARTLLASFIGGAFMVLIAISALLVPNISIIPMLVGVTSSIIRFIESVKEIWILLQSLVRVAPTTLLIVTGALLAGWITLAVLAWGVSVWRVSIKKVNAK